MRLKNRKNVHDLGMLGTSSKSTNFSKFWTRAANGTMGKG